MLTEHAKKWKSFGNEFKKLVEKYNPERKDDFVSMFIQTITVQETAAIKAYDNNKIYENVVDAYDYAGDEYIKMVNLS